MTHYEVLGVPENASSTQIRNAYRRLVKQYHPDYNPSAQAAELIKQINEAYDVLSDSEKRTAYDRRYYQYFETIVKEDPNETYRQEYLRKRREKEKQTREYEAKFEELKEGFKIKIFRAAYWMVFPIVLYAFVAVLDTLLPDTTFEETAEYGWQTRTGRSSSKRYHSFMKTKSFEFAAPNEVHVDYSYTINPEPLVIHVSPIFKRIQRVELKRELKIYSWNPRSTLTIGLEYLLLISSIVALLIAKYSETNFYLRLAPIGTAVFIYLLSRL